MSAPFHLFNSVITNDTFLPRPCYYLLSLKLQWVHVIVLQIYIFRLLQKIVCFQQLSEFFFSFFLTFPALSNVHKSVKQYSLFTCKDFCSHFISSLELFCISSPIYDSFVATLFRSKSLLNMFPLFLLPFCIINSLQFLCGNYCLSSLDHQFSFSHDAHDNLKNYFKCLFMIISSWIPSSFIEMLI